MAAGIAFRSSRADDDDRVVEIWCAAVDATHDFLEADDRIALEELVRDFLSGTAMALAVDAGDRAIAFMLVDQGHMEALFVDPAHRGAGIGAALVRQALGLNPGMTTDVNEQNVQAMAFYDCMGFVSVGRSPLDGQGLPYPLIHLVHRE